MCKSGRVTSRLLAYQSSRYYVERRTTLLPNGLEGTKDIIVHPGAVVILAVNEDAEIIAIRQFRQTITDFLLELPAGTIENSEDPLETAQRELQEEAGVSAKNWTSLGYIYSAPGLTDEKLHLYFASGLEQSVLPHDEDEVIEPLKMSSDDFASAVAQGKLQDAKSIALFYRCKLAGLI